MKYRKHIASSNSDFHLKIKYSHLKLCDEPNLNTKEAPLPVYLFD